MKEKKKKRERESDNKVGGSDWALNETDKRSCPSAAADAKFLRCQRKKERGNICTSYPLVVECVIDRGGGCQ